MKRTYFYVKKTECVSILVWTICKFQRKKSESRPSFQLCIKTIMSQFFHVKVDVYCLAVLTFLPWFSGLRRGAYYVQVRIINCQIWYIFWKKEGAWRG
jgi:hypothetical protein